MSQTPGDLNFGYDAIAQKLTLNGQIILGSIVGPFFSPAGTGSIYYDSASQRLKASENGGAPVNLLTGGGGGTAIEFIQNAHVSLPQQNKLSFDGTIISAANNSGAAATDVTIQKADNTHDGYLSHTDFNTFNSHSGTVTSVAMNGDGTIYNTAVPGSPVTSSGTLAPTLHTQSNNTVLAGPNGGGPLAPTFRSLVNADLPTSGVTAGSYTNTNLTVNAQGIITAASNGSGGSGSDKSVRVRSTAGQALTANMFQALTFNATDYDTDSMSGVGGAHPTRLTCNTAGKFLVHGAVSVPHFLSGTDYALEIQILKNGTTPVMGNQRILIGTGVVLDDIIDVTGIIPLTGGDFIEFTVNPTASGITSDANAGFLVPVFEMVRQPG